jgi:hypothetical protein
LEFIKGKEAYMRKIGLGLFIIMIFASSVVLAQDSQTATLKGKGDSHVLPLDCGSLPTNVDTYLGIKEVTGSVATLPCSENGGVDCPNGYKIMANIQIDRGCGPQFSTGGPVPVTYPEWEFVDCDAGDGEIIASFIDYGEEGGLYGGRLIEVIRSYQFTPDDPSDDSATIRISIYTYEGWKCHRSYGAHYEGRRVTCR